MDDLTSALARLIEAKETCSRRLASLPFPEKVRIIIQFQKLAAPPVSGSR